MLHVPENWSSPLTELSLPWLCKKQLILLKWPLNAWIIIFRIVMAQLYHKGRKFSEVYKLSDWQSRSRWISTPVSLFLIHSLKICSSSIPP